MSQTSRKLTRKLLFQKLYVLWFSFVSDEDFLKSFYFDDWKNKLDKQYFLEMQEIILEKEWFFIEIIQKYAPKFQIENMSLLYILPIYIALAEMFFLKEEIPALVSLNEAIELSKIYWDNPVKKIVNWVLNNVLKDYESINKHKNDNLKIKKDFSFFKTK